MGARINRFITSFSGTFLAAAIAFPAASSAEVAVTPSLTVGEEPAQIVDHVENARFQFIGEINSDNVHARSGPGENHYATMRINKGAQVTVLGMKFNWLKILPPEGSYSVISRQFVKRDPVGNTGVVTATNVNVRAAGNASNLKTLVQCRLNAGDVVEILGEEDQYYQIRPPADACLFVNQNVVTPVRQINVEPVARQERREIPPTGSFERPEQSDDPANTFVVGPTTRPANAGDAAAQRPTTQPVRWDLAKIQGEFDRLEDLVKAAADQPLDEQPIGAMIAGYEGLMQQQRLPAAMRQVAHVRVLTLKVKLKSQEEYLATQKLQDAAEQRLAQLRAQREAVEQRMAGNVTVFTAVGTLQASTLQAGSGTLYRLTDPATGRTLCYIRGTRDPKFVTFVEKFVGVKGELTTDPQLSMRVIPATEIVAVDPQKVNKTIVAQVVPPSLVNGISEPKQ